MPESVYDVILLIGSSKESWEKAAANAVEQASKSLRNLRVAEIVELDMALSGHAAVVSACRLLGDQRTWVRRSARSVDDPERTSAVSSLALF